MSEWSCGLLDTTPIHIGSLFQVTYSQIPVEKWHEYLDDRTVADAILDRLIHNAYKIKLKGESMRKKKLTRSEKKG